MRRCDVIAEGRYMVRERVPDRRHRWCQKVVIHDEVGGRQSFYVEFGEYDDGRLAEVFITSRRCGDSFTRGALDSLAKSISVALQSGTSPHEMAHTLSGQNYPPNGKVEALGSTVTSCTSIADYIAQEIMDNYGEDGKPRPEPPPPPVTEKVAGYISPEPPGSN